MHATEPTAPRSESTSPSHHSFLAMLPIVERHARVVFRRLPPAELDEAVAEATAWAFVLHVRLIERGKDPAHFPSALGTFAALHVKCGRTVGSRWTSNDVLSPTAQRQRRFSVQRLPECRPALDKLLRDRTQPPIPDQVAFHLDFAAFLTTLSDRDIQMIAALAAGHSGRSVAARFRLTPMRISQLRRQWHLKWYAFTTDRTAA